MKIITNIFASSLGKKYIMAVTGFVLFLFVLGHLAGNLQIFLGREAINRYGHFLQSNPELIWPARIVLLILLLLHIWSALALTLENRAARPVGYEQFRPIGSTFASRWMLVSGVIVFLFIVYHLMHFTFQVEAINGTHQDFRQFNEPGPGWAASSVPVQATPSTPPAVSEGRHDIFKMMVMGFSIPWVTAFYVIGVGLLCLHLSHGASSMFQSMGWRNEAYRPFLEKAAWVIAIVIFLGYISIPLAVLFGYGKEALK